MNKGNIAYYTIIVPFTSNYEFIYWQWVGYIISTSNTDLLIYRFLVVNLTLIINKVLSKTANLNIAEVLHRPIRALVSPENSNMGVSIGIFIQLQSKHPYFNIIIQSH